MVPLKPFSAAYQNVLVYTDFLLYEFNFLHFILFTLKKIGGVCMSMHTQSKALHPVPHWRQKQRSGKWIPFPFPLRPSPLLFLHHLLGAGSVHVLDRHTSISESLIYKVTWLVENGQGVPCVPCGVKCAQ